AGENPILLRYRPSPLKNTARSPTASRSGGTGPKYAALTIAPRAASGPGSNGTTTVVCGDGLNIPRIHTETRPPSFVHGFVPAFVILFSDSKATACTGSVPVIPRSFRAC